MSRYLFLHLDLFYFIIFFESLFPKLLPSTLTCLTNFGTMKMGKQWWQLHQWWESREGGFCWYPAEQAMRDKFWNKINHGELGSFGSWYYRCCTEEKRTVKDRKTKKDYKKQNITKLTTSTINFKSINLNKFIQGTNNRFSNWLHILPSTLRLV